MEGRKMSQLETNEQTDGQTEGGEPEGLGRNGVRDGRTEGQTEGGVEGGRVCDSCAYNVANVGTFHLHHCYSTFSPSLQTTPACHQIHRTMVKNAENKVILI